MKGIPGGATILLLLAAAAFAAPAAAQPAHVDAKRARTKNEEALRHHRDKNYPAALSAFREAYALNPADPEIVNNLAFLLHTLGNVEEAEKYYRLALELEPERLVAKLNLIDLLARDGESEERLGEAADLLARAREESGNKPGLLLRQARVAGWRGRFQEAERFYEEYLSLEVPNDERRFEIGDFYRDFGREIEALSWYRQVADSAPAELREKAARRIWEVEVGREARKLGWQPLPDGRVDESLERQVRTAARMRKAHQYYDAERLVREVLERSPLHAGAWRLLGDILNDTVRKEEAQLAYLKAVALAPGEAETNAALGRFYLAAPGGGRAAEAARFLSNALKLKPGWLQLRFELALALRANGEILEAVNQLGRIEAEAYDEEEKARASEIKRELLDKLAAHGGGPSVEAAGLAPAAGPEASARTAVEAVTWARTLLERDEPDKALIELRRLSDADRNEEVLNLEARILFLADRGEEAIALLEDSLRRDEAQAEAHSLVGRLYVGKERTFLARTHLARAEELGDPAAAYYLSRLDLGQGEGVLHDLLNLGTLLASRTRLERYLGLEEPEPMHRQEAEKLHAEAGGRLRNAVLTAAGLLAVVAALVFLVWRRRWGGADLETLVLEAPEAGPQIQRTLAAIRHEVLKHNTMVLTGLVEAIESGSGEASRKAAFLMRNLLGSGAEPGVFGRLQAYRKQLEQIGRSNGVRLNLRRKDPALAAILAGFSLLESASGSLARVEQLGRPERARLLGLLKEASHLLNVEGYEAVRTILDRLRVLAVDEALLRSIFQLVTREPAFSGLAFPALAFESSCSLPVGIPVPRPDFEDVMANLFRNAAASSIEEGLEPAVGLTIDLDRDPITGLENVLFKVWDCSPRELTVEQIRGRGIEGGLGLALDRAARYEGSLDVIGDGGVGMADWGTGTSPSGPRWRKAVVVRFPLAPLSQGSFEGGQ
jgi:Flp pilus assembly protein TadD